MLDSKTTWHVSPAISNRKYWAVRRHGTIRAIKIFKTKQGAINRASAYARKFKGQFFVQDKNGCVEHRKSFI